jgi:hypothetical protein
MEINRLSTTKSIGSVMVTAQAEKRCLKNVLPASR